MCAFNAIPKKKRLYGVMRPELSLSRCILMQRYLWDMFMEAIHRHTSSHLVTVYRDIALKPTTGNTETPQLQNSSILAGGSLLFNV